MKPENCAHRSLQKKRNADPHGFECETYVCGACSTLFDVKQYEAPKPAKPEPMFDGRKPWGTRSRQA